MQARPFRYDIRRPLEFNVRGPEGPVIGFGRTVNISRRGVLFEPEAEVDVGGRIELNVQLGSFTKDGPEVSLHVQGVIVRRDARGVAVSIRKHRLRRAKLGAGKSIYTVSANF